MMVGHDRGWEAPGHRVGGRRRDSRRRDAGVDDATEGIVCCYTFSAAVLPPVLGPVMMTQRVSGDTHTSIGTGGEGLSSLSSPPSPGPAPLLLDPACRANCIWIVHGRKMDTALKEARLDIWKHTAKGFSRRTKTEVLDRGCMAMLCFGRKSNAFA